MQPDPHRIAPQNRSTRSLSYGLIGVLLLAALLSGCLRASARSSQVTLDLAPFLPPEWTPLGDLQPIDIDQDDTLEYLMLYTYDQSSEAGPVGALILDPQAETIVTESGDRALSRPASFPNPYALLPSYWQGAGQGFIADPNQADAITTHQVVYVSVMEGGQPAKPDTLILRGGNTYLTFVWWKNVVDGYGVTQLYASGGFEGVNWDTWAKAPQPLYSITASAPLHDRNLFCRKTRYDLTEPGIINPLAYRQAIEYSATDLGLYFCFGIPAHPFYPEGVVLAYLTDPSRRQELVVDTLRNNPNAQAEWAQGFNPNNVVRVDDVLGYPDIPVVRSGLTEPPTSLNTTVCAEVIVTRSGDTPQSEKRWLLFTLQHQPPHLDPPTPDRLLIVNVEPILASTAEDGVNCRKILEIS